MNNLLNDISTGKFDDYFYNDTEGIEEDNSTYSNESAAPAEWDPWHPPYAIRANRTYYSLVAIYMSFLFFFAFILNVLVLYTAYKNRILRTPLNYIILNLTVADLLSVIFSCFVGIATNASGRFFFGKWMCQAEGYLASVSGITGLVSIAVMAFERYFVICKPFGPVRFAENHAILGILFSWLYSLAWNSPPLIFWDGYEAEGLGTTCAPNYFVTDPGQRLFIVLYFVFCFIIPFSAIFLSYGKLIMTLRQMAKESTVSSSSNVSADQEVTKMVVMMVAAFTFCWVPYSVVSMMTVFSDNKNYALGAIPAFFAKSASIYNPLIYIGLNRQFRDCTIKALFNGKNPWSDDIGATSSMMSTTSATTTISTNKVGPA